MPKQDSFCQSAGLLRLLSANPRRCILTYLLYAAKRRPHGRVFPDHAVLARSVGGLRTAVERWHERLGMGVPTFYRYIHEKFPKAVRDYIEVMPDGLDAATEADWSAEPNPNGIEVDNLYLDFNGIVHNATHPEDRPAPSGFDAMMLEVFRRVDRIVLAARPRRLLYLALDGVAPRAKMNQQRSRRFMAVREASSRRPSALDAAGVEDDGDGRFDHNAITPGTEFMQQLGRAMVRARARLGLGLGLGLDLGLG